MSDMVLKFDKVEVEDARIRLGDREYNVSGFSSTFTLLNGMF